MSTILQRFMIVGLLASFTPACGPKVPSTYSSQAQRASNATQLLQSLIALGQTVQNLNALPAGSPGRVPDADVIIVRDGSLVISDALTAYVSTGTGAALLDGYNGMMVKLSMNTKLSPSVKIALALINTNIQLVIGAAR